MALLSRLHWWTVEYGLIGTFGAPKIYGAGLLSSIGESVSCLEPQVKRIPYSIEAAETAFDITTKQPQLFVCRDFQHLAITFCRCLNIPARYATGYLGDIGVPFVPPMDFSAWFEVYLQDRWWTFDARNNKPRIGRVLMATGRDAADVAITTSFGSGWLTSFTVITDEVAAGMPTAQ